MSLLGRAVRSIITSQSLWGDVHKSPYNAEFGLTYASGGQSFAGISVTHEVAMTFSAVFACVRLISDTIAAMPVELLQAYPTGKYRRPRLPWMIQPNPEMTWQEFIQQLVTARLMDGNAYFIPVSKGGRVIELWPLDPLKVNTARSSSTGKLGYVVHDQPVAGRDIVHLRGLTLPGYDKGLSPIECARHTIGLALSAEKHGSKLFAQGTAFDTVIKAKRSLTPDEAKQLAKGFALHHSGGDKSFTPAIIDGDADIQHYSMTAEEAQFLTTRQFQVEEVARWYGVPPHRIALTDKATSWGSGIEQQNIAFLQDAITPIIVSLEAAFTPLVRYENPDYYVKFSVSGLMRGDMAARKDYYKTMVEIGAYSQDDVLALEDMNPLPHGLGQGHYFPLNFAPIGAPIPGGEE